MLKIGLTSGIGSGKSTVAAIFETFGIPVYYADSAAKNIMNDNSFVRKSVENYFGTNSYINGKLNREYLSQQVFNNTEKLRLLNSIVHPAAIEDATLWMEKQTASYIIKEAALLFESGSDKSLDLIIGVSAPVELRIQRAIKRDNITRKHVMNIISNQMNEEEKMSKCNFVIINDEQQLILPQVLALHEKFMALSKNYTTN